MRKVRAKYNIIQSSFHTAQSFKYVSSIVIECSLEYIVSYVSIEVQAAQGLALPFGLENIQVLLVQRLPLQQIVTIYRMPRHFYLLALETITIRPSHFDFAIYALVWRQTAYF